MKVIPVLWLAVMAGAFAPRPEPAGYAPARPDTTLTLAVVQGGVLVARLPDSLGTRFVESYEGVRVPADGWLVDRSWFWRTGTAAAGTYEFMFRARMDEATGDTVIVQVRVSDDD